MLFLLCYFLLFVFIIFVIFILHYYTYYIRQIINTLESILYLNDDYFNFIITMHHCHSSMIITTANYRKTSGSVLA